ncbi:hypothetical protein Harman_06290 [Haloarcula mannanilytica]|uniref:Uncharacterized protein n=1 Tax=Haloarcula mannanilytica TaxID=2509225 RepID=A0A4C2EED6_9EURY|nr:hypothetical protein [Haloarcula mannanilytica]GCF12694.1 hypothetical protein Harman_06290 [Haloarcula mannanilytica]
MPAADNVSAVGRRRAKLAGVVIGSLGFVLALAQELAVLASGLWYPVIYAGAPALASVAAFVHERPTAGPLRLVGVGSWVLVTSVLALAVLVVLVLGFPAQPRFPGFELLFAGLLYAGFCLVPASLAAVAARQRGVRTVALLALVPLGQTVVAAVLVFAR